MPGTSGAGTAAIIVRHAQGETVLTAPPRRVVVFDPVTLDTLDALGVEEAGVAVVGVPGANLPDVLGKYRDARTPKVGTLFEPDYEAVAAAAPDLIIVGGRSAAKTAALARIAPTIDLTIDPARFIAGARANVELLGRIFGRPQQAAALEARLDGALERVRTQAPQVGRVLLVMVNGGKLSAYGAGSRFGWIYSDLGLTPVSAGKAGDTHGDVVSFEFILKADPDYLLVLDRDAAVSHSGDAARRALDNDIIAATAAAKAGHIVYLDAPRWYIAAGGGRALPHMVEDLSAAFGPAPGAAR